jgi:ribonuclease HII
VLLPFYQLGLREAGCDEAGRGCLAGPVVAAAVILPADFNDPTINDSKKLGKSKREKLRHKILDAAIAYGIGMVDNEEIDKMNILNASFKAMHLAIKQLHPEKFNFLLIDGNRFKPYRSVKHACIVKGDGKYMSIAAASILAKTHRDELMSKYAEIYPQYDWHKNVGYPTRTHREAIRKFGITEYHRKTFRLLDDQQALFQDK